MNQNKSDEDTLRSPLDARPSDAPILVLRPLALPSTPVLLPDISSAVIGYLSDCLRTEDEPVIWHNYQEKLKLLSVPCEAACWEGGGLIVFSRRRGQEKKNPKPSPHPPARDPLLFSDCTLTIQRAKIPSVCHHRMQMARLCETQCIIVPGRASGEEMSGGDNTQSRG